MKENGDPYVVIQNEKLFNFENKTVAFEEYDKITSFLLKNDYYLSQKQHFEWKYECLWGKLLPNDIGRFGQIHRKKPSKEQSELYINKQFAYQALLSSDDEYNNDTICYIWKRISKEAIEYGYENWNNIEC